MNPATLAQVTKICARAAGDNFDLSAYIKDIKAIASQFSEDVNTVFLGASLPVIHAMQALVANDKAEELAVMKSRFPKLSYSGVVFIVCGHLAANKDKPLPAKALGALANHLSQSNRLEYFLAVVRQAKKLQDTVPLFHNLLINQDTVFVKLEENDNAMTRLEDRLFLARLANIRTFMSMQRLIDAATVDVSDREGDEPEAKRARVE